MQFSSKLGRTIVTIGAIGITGIATEVTSAAPKPSKPETHQLGRRWSSTQNHHFRIPIAHKGGKTVVVKVKGNPPKHYMRFICSKLFDHSCIHYPR